MIAVLFTKPIQEIIKEQQLVQKEIALKNKELRDLFSSKYNELLNCTDLLNGISDYTKEIITISNKTQQYMLQINEQQPVNQQKSSSNKPKQFSYFIKKIKQSIAKGHCYYAYISLKHLKEHYTLNETENLYTQLFMEQIQSNFDFSNIIDCLLTHTDVKQFFEKLIIYGSENCENFQLAITYVNQIQQFQNYQDLIMLRESKLSIDQIYELLTTSTIPPLQIDDLTISLFSQQILSETLEFKERLLQNLISNIIQSKFNHQLFQQIQLLDISNELKQQTTQLWIQWFSQRIEESINQINQCIQSEFIDFNIFYKNYTEFVNQLYKEVEQIQHKQEYRYEDCIQILKVGRDKIQDTFNTLFEGKSFEICFYYNLLLNYWNEKIPEQLILFQGGSENWDLRAVDQILFQIYKLQDYGIKREVISQIIKIMLSKVDIQFSIEYRNLATAIHPEKAQKFYQELFANGKFNNKQLKRLQVSFDSDQQFESPYYTIISQQKSAVKDQLNAWTQRAQETQPQKQEQQQSRFGLNLFWKKQ